MTTKKRHLLLMWSFGMLLSFNLVAQENRTQILEATNVEKLQELAKEFRAKERLNRERALKLASEKGWLIREEAEDGRVIELIGITDEGRPIYYTTSNDEAAETISTDEVKSGGAAGLTLTGSGFTVGEWDGGAIRATHQEFGSRVTQVDGATTTSSHSTHVAGTLMASGVDANAQGMAHAADLAAYDWTSDGTEMATAAAGGMLVSNHSYGTIGGWNQASSGTWYWYGDPAINGNEDYKFGAYDQSTRDWDLIAENAPYYLIVKAAGNDRNDTGPGTGTSYYYWSNSSSSWVLANTSSSPRPTDGNSGAGFDCITAEGNAKNILTVGSVLDIAGGYVNAAGVTASSFTSWGPTDDGRIKPDICGNGDVLYSAEHTSNTAYTTKSGTSMASPSVAGSLILLQEHYEDTHGSGNYMLAATLKGLVIHTADEAGAAAGPDYSFGWGLMNTQKAAAVITEDVTKSISILETILYNGNTHTLNVVATGGQPLVTTVSWTDVAGTANADGHDINTIKLVNDLDIRVVDDVTGTTYYPYVLNPASPASAATTGDNIRDNVEKISFTPVAGRSYTITISHKGSLTNGFQRFSLITTGINSGSASCAIVNQFPHILDFESGTSGWAQGVSPFDNFDWWVNSGSTPSTSTGPSSANGGLNYLYAESSLPNYPTKTATFLSPCLDFSSLHDPQISFYYHMYGSSMGTLHVDVSLDGGVSWTNVWALSGDQGNAWHPIAVSLTNYGYQSSVRVRFRAETGSSYLSDIAIDDVVVGAPNNPTCASARTVTETGTYYTDGPSDGAGCKNCSFGATHSDWWKFTAPQTGKVKIASCGYGVDTRLFVYTGSCGGTLLSYANNDDACSMGSGLSNYASQVVFNVTAGTTYYFEWDDRWSSSGFFFDFDYYTCETTVANFPYQQSFETNFGNWKQSIRDDFDWTRHSGSTPSFNTGPTSAYNGSYYLYTEASSPNFPTKTAILNSPCFNLTGNPNMNLSFAYNMYGADIGSLTVQISTDYGYSWGNLWKMSGDQGSGWNHQVISLSAYSGTVKFRFVGVTGANYAGDMAIDYIRITPPLSVTLASTSDCSSSFGTVTSNVSGGVAPYSYLWSNGATTANLSNLSAGNYTVTVTDAIGSTKSAAINVVASPSVAFTAIIAHDWCVTNSGIITLTVTSGSPPYSYFWSHAPLNNSLQATALSAGTYSVIVTDANGCSASANYTVLAPANALNGTTSSTADLCNTGVGTATVHPTGGTLPYTYKWSGNTGYQNTATATGLFAGNYTVTVTDANGCRKIISTLVTNTTSPITIGFSTTNETCFNSGGSAKALPANGVAPYTYAWSNGGTTKTISNLSAGAYTVTVTDANGCTAIATTTITNINSTILLTFTTIGEACGNSSGAATVTPSNGAAPYTYQWDVNTGSQTTQTATGLSSGSYTVTVIDANGCTATNNVIVSSIAPPVNFGFSYKNDSCSASVGSATALPTSGTPPYAYQWDANTGNQTTQTATGLSTGSYTVTVTDGNGCLATNTVFVGDTCTTIVFCEINWLHLNNATVSGGILQKTAPTNFWDAGGLSLEALDANADGAIQTRILETNTDRMFGFAAANNSTNINDLDFAFQFKSNGAYRIFESGNDLGSFGSYSTGDVFMIDRTGGVVTYYRNGNLVYTSTVASSGVIFADAIFRTPNATIFNAERSFACNSVCNLQLSLNSKINESCAGNDGAAIVQALGSTGVQYFWTDDPSIKTPNRSNLTAGTYTVIGYQPITGCSDTLTFVLQGCTLCPVVWSNLLRTQLNGDTLVKTANNNAWNASAISSSFLAAGQNGMVRTTIIETNTERILGLGGFNPNTNINLIDYAIQFLANGKVRVREAGVLKGFFGSYFTGDTYSIERNGMTIEYKRNGTTFYTSLTPSFGDLWVDINLRTPAATLYNVEKSWGCGPCTLQLNLIATSDPTCNGDDGSVAIGANFPNITYVWADNNAPADSILTTLGFGTFSVIATNPADLCQDTITFDLYDGCGGLCWANWATTNAVLNTGTTIVKSGGNFWNGVAVTAQELPAGVDGLVRMTVGETNTDRSLGFVQSANAGNGYNSVDFGIRLTATGDLVISELGTTVGNFGFYQTGDVLSIHRIGTTIFYKRNGATFYTSTVSSATALKVEASLKTPGGTIFNVEMDFDCTSPSVGMRGNTTVAHSNSDRFNTNDISIFPNPTTNGQTTLAFDFKDRQNLQIDVFSATGQRLVSQKLDDVQRNNHLLDLSAQPDGLYLIQIRSGKKVATYRVVLVR